MIDDEKINKEQDKCICDCEKCSHANECAVENNNTGLHWNPDTKTVECDLEPVIEVGMDESADMEIMTLGDLKQYIAEVSKHTSESAEVYVRVQGTSPSVSPMWVYVD